MSDDEKTVVPFSSDEPAAPKSAHEHCSFCGKSRDQVKKIIAGPSGAICVECLAQCNHLLETKDQG